MHLRTTSVEDTERFTAMANDVLAMRKIRKILNNHQSFERQIKAIKDVTSPPKKEGK